METFNNKKTSEDKSNVNVISSQEFIKSFKDQKTHEDEQEIKDEEFYHRMCKATEKVAWQLYDKSKINLNITTVPEFINSSKYKKTLKDEKRERKAMLNKSKTIVRSAPGCVRGKKFKKSKKERKAEIITKVFYEDYKILQDKIYKMFDENYKWDNVLDNQYSLSDIEEEEIIDTDNESESDEDKKIIDLTRYTYTDVLAAKELINSLRSKIDEKESDKIVTIQLFKD